MPALTEIPIRPLSMVNVSAMSKEQARNYLQTLGEEAHPKWTSLEIKSRIKELMERDQRKGLGGVNSNSTRAELEQKCRATGTTVTTHDTRGSLLRKLRLAQEFEEKGSDETIVGFGRYPDKKYKEVPQGYLDWVMQTFHENPTECQGKLARLAAWAMTQQVKPEESADETPQLTATSSAASSAGVPVAPGRSRKKRATGEPEDVESGPTQMEQNLGMMLGQMMTGMQQLQTRMIDLEQRQTKNPDEMKPEEPTPSQTGGSFKMVYPWPADELGRE